MKTKLISIEVIPHPKLQDKYRLTITWLTKEGMVVSDESSHLFLQGVEEELRLFRIKHDL